MAETPRLSRLDESFAQKVDEILEGDTDKVPVRVQISLLLAMQSQILRGVNGVMDRQDIANGRTGKLESEVINLKSKNIVEWVTKNPKSAILWLLTGFFALEVLANELTNAQNIEFILGIVKKWLGI